MTRSYRACFSSLAVQMAKLKVCFVLPSTEDAYNTCRRMQEAILAPSQGLQMAILMLMQAFQMRTIHMSPTCTAGMSCVYPHRA
jgi:hypothetical protein